MAFGSVTLVPGVNSERTPTLLRAGFATASLVRFRDSLVEKIGGWVRFYPFAVSGVPRELHAWQDLNGVRHLAIGTTGPGSSLDVVTVNSLADLTPQILKSSFAPNFSTTAGSPTVAIIDPNISNLTTFDSIFFNVPVSIGGLVLSGLFPISLVTGGTSYQITAASNATTTTVNPTATNAATAIGNNTLNFASTPSWLVNGVTTIYDLTHPTAIPAATVVSASGGTTVTMSNTAAVPGVSNGDSIVFASVPIFTTSVGSERVTVKLAANGLAVGSVIVFQIPTTKAGVTIFGAYAVVAVQDPNTFIIASTTQATASLTFTMSTT